MLLSVFLAATSFLLPTSAFAHGEIESIQCEDTRSKVSLTSTKIDEKLIASFQLQKEGYVKDFEPTQLQLDDTAERGQVIENIKFSFKEGKAHLKIIEDYSKTVREGKGELKLAKHNIDTKNLKCKVKYPKP